MTDIFIRVVAAEVKGHGDKYEDNLKAWEYENTKYAFLTDRKVSHSFIYVFGTDSNQQSPAPQTRILPRVG